LVPGEIVESIRAEQCGCAKPPNPVKFAPQRPVGRLFFPACAFWAALLGRSRPEDLSIAAEREDRRNEEITAPRIRVIADDGSQVGVLTRMEALAKAEAAGLDLVEISPNAEPPVCKIMDYGKYLYQKDKALQAARKKQKQIQVKEVKFRPTTEEADYQTKLRNLTRFLDEGDKIKVTVRYRGREMQHQELGLKLLERVRDELDPLAVVEQMPRLEMRQMVMVMSPKKR
jgi:translation initiation factor IF-3